LEIARRRGKNPDRSHATGGRDGAEETQPSGKGFLFFYIFFSLNWFLFIFCSVWLPRKRTRNEKEIMGLPFISLMLPQIEEIEELVTGTRIKGYFGNLA
jgi:hypothetical protein